MKCRFCQNELTHEFVDLGFSPPSNSYLKAEQLINPEVYFPLKIMVCDYCYLVQIDEVAKHNEIFNDEYAYFSSYSTSWLDHARKYSEMMIQRFGFNEKSLIIEIASNDGYLLKNFHQKNIPVLGIEPTSNTASVAISQGIKTEIDFFSTRLAEKLIAKDIKADLLLGNNVLAHVPDIKDFVQGLKLLLNNKGVITFEFPHLLKLIQENQFDTIYHEHFSYLSLNFIVKLFNKYNLDIFDVEEVSTHGGSLRIFAKHSNDNSKIISTNVANLVKQEIEFGLNEIEFYKSFQKKADTVKNHFLEFLLQTKKDGKSVIAYGAAAKGVTLLNYAGVRKDLIPYVIDASPHKQNRFIPGVHIPIVNIEIIKTIKPDFVVILPWNLKEEISSQLSYIKEWNGKFVVAIPELIVF